MAIASSFQPCVPPEWSQFKITYRFRSATYAISVENTTGAEIEASRLSGSDDSSNPENSIPLADDSLTHEVRVVVGHSLIAWRSGPFKAERKKDGRSTSLQQSSHLQVAHGKDASCSNRVSLLSTTCAGRR